MTRLERLKVECTKMDSNLIQLKRRIKNLSLLEKLGIDEEYRINQLKSVPLLNDLMKTEYNCNEEKVVFMYRSLVIPDIDFSELQKVDFIKSVEMHTERHPQVHCIISSNVTIHFKEENWEEIKNA